jgi:hypothetical protein
MKRDEEWTFDFQVARVRDSAREQAESHRAHADYWAKKAAEWQEEKTATAKIEEVPVTGEVQHMLRYDPGLSKKLEEARSRRQYHSQAANEFEQWVYVLNERPDEDVLQLRFADVAARLRSHLVG